MIRKNMRSNKNGSLSKMINYQIKKQLEFQ